MTRALSPDDQHFADADAEPASAAEWFLRHGVHVFPTVNKVPAVPKGTSQFDYRCTYEEAARFREYGVALGLLAVVDSDNPKAEAWNAAHLPDTPFTVTTGPYHDGSPGRGRHRYYRLVGDAPHFLHRDGLTIELRHRGQYVVGPGSMRPDGVRYVADAWSWRWEDITIFPAAFLFDDGSCGTFSRPGEALVLPEAVSAGERHAVLHRLMRSLAAHGVPLDGAVVVCRIENTNRCRPPLADNPLDEKADGTLETFLRRAYTQRDRGNFVRSPKTGWLLAGTLLELGLSVEVALVAVRSIDPTFDPETNDAIYDPEAGA